MGNASLSLVASDVDTSRPGTFALHTPQKLGEMAQESAEELVILPIQLFSLADLSISVHYVHQSGDDGWRYRGRGAGCRCHGTGQTIPTAPLATVRTARRHLLSPLVFHRHLRTGHTAPPSGDCRFSARLAAEAKPGQ